jgi:Protein of unknown function (DUF541)
MILRLVYSFVILSAALCAQVTQGSITVTASRNTTLQPDQAVFGVTVATPVSATRDDAVAALAGTGITAANFTSVSSSTQFATSPAATQQTILQWTFNLTVAIGDLKTTVSQLSAAQANTAKKNNGFSVSFGVQSTTVSDQQLASKPCPISDLLADARAQAQKVGSASNLNVGAILSMAAPVIANTPACSLTVKFVAFPF